MQIATGLSQKSKKWNKRTNHNTVFVWVYDTVSIKQPPNKTAFKDNFPIFMPKLTPSLLK